MSSEPAIRLRGVAKSFRLYKRTRERLIDLLSGGRRSGVRRFEALKGIDLDVARGETLGLVGANGSGKSTLLQMICGTLKADEGEVLARGRIAALLELGASFNPEFTGRENVEINGLLMGLSKAELAERFDDILAFADIGAFIDQPVKTYSSGMFARLAFAVAIHVDPDILLIDEALAVGDEAFRRKCYARLDKIKAKGTTIMFVSHSASAILELCDRAVLLHRGERLLTGRPRDVMSHYQKLIYAAPEHHPEILQAIRALDEAGPETPTAPAPERDGDPGGRDFFDPDVRSRSTERYPPRGCEIGDVAILDRRGREVNKLVPGGRYVYRYDVTFTEDAEDVRFVMLLKTTTGIELGGQWSAPRDEGIAHVAAGSVLRVRLPFALPFNAGTYFGNAGVHGVVGGESVVMHRLVDAILFRVQPEGKSRADRYVDITDDPAEIELLEAPAAERRASA